MEIGLQLNQRYTLTARLGQGAMGQVYRALDAQSRQEVALKVIARDLTFDSEMLQRFRREGEALRQLRHPNIVGFIEMFAHEGQNIIAMEYVPGGSLHELIQKGPLPAERARRIALEIGDALTRAHHIGIIHRDLKPENVLLTADGSPKVSDFGVARLVDEGTRLTGTGAQVGTPYYMSPEAWEGKPLDGQADVWSLGVVFFEMLTGKLPFNGDTVVAVMNQVLNASVPDLSALRPDAPPGLARIIGRMLCRSKAERYQSMREVAADIERGDIAVAPRRPAAVPAPAPRPAAEQTRVAQPRAAPAGAPNRWRSVGLTLVRLGLTALIGLAVIGCVVVVGGALLLSNVLEGVVTSIPFFPNEIGPGATYTFSRQDVESQLNRQVALTLPGTLSDLRLTFIPTDTLHVNAKVFGGDAALALRAEASNGLPRVYLVSYNSLPLPLVGDMLLNGVNRGLAKVFTQDKLEMVSILFSSEQLTLVLNGPGVQKQTKSSCVSNQSFNDQFGAVHGAWDTFETAEAKAYIENGTFVLRAIAPQTVLIQYLGGCEFGDAQITAEAANPTPDIYAEYGLLFNRTDAQNYMAFLVTTTGFYAFDKVTAGQHALWPAGWTGSHLIHTDSQVNLLGLRVEGTLVTPSINGQALPSYNANAASWGNVGLVVTSGGNINAEIDFRNFGVAMLSEATPFPTTPPSLPQPTGQASAKVQSTLSPMVTPSLTARLAAGPTGRIAFVSQRDRKGQEIYVMNADGAGLTPLTDSVGNKSGGISWRPDGTMLTFSWAGSLYNVSLPGPATPALLISGAPNDTYQGPNNIYGGPAWSPDGLRLAYSYGCRDVGCDGHTMGLYVLSDKQRRQLVSSNGSWGFSQPTWSADGRRIFFALDAALYSLEVDSGVRQKLGQAPTLHSMTWAPGGSRLAAVQGSQGGGSEIVVADPSGANPVQLTTEGNNSAPAWSPDGQYLVFCSDRDGNNEIYIMKADGTGQTNLTRNPADDCPTQSSAPAWGP